MFKAKALTALTVTAIFGLAACGADVSDQNDSTVTTVVQKNAALTTMPSVSGCPTTLPPKIGVATTMAPRVGIATTIPSKIGCPTGVGVIAPPTLPPSPGMTPSGPTAGSGSTGGMTPSGPATGVGATTPACSQAQKLQDVACKYQPLNPGN
jgi:hypothetical protein